MCHTNIYVFIYIYTYINIVTVTLILPKRQQSSANTTVLQWLNVWPLVLCTRYIPPSPFFLTRSQHTTFPCTVNYVISSFTVGPLSVLYTVLYLPLRALKLGSGRNYSQFPHEVGGWDESLDCQRPSLYSLITVATVGQAAGDERDKHAHKLLPLLQGASEMPMYNLFLHETIDTKQIKRPY